MARIRVAPWLALAPWLAVLAPGCQEPVQDCECPGAVEGRPPAIVDDLPALEICELKLEEPVLNALVKTRGGQLLPVSIDGSILRLVCPPPGQREDAELIVARAGADGRPRFEHKQGLNLADSARRVGTAEFSRGLSDDMQRQPEVVDKIALLLVGGPIDDGSGGPIVDETETETETGTETEGTQTGITDDPPERGRGSGGGGDSGDAEDSASPEPSEALPTNTQLRPTLDAVDKAALACGVDHVDNLASYVKVRYAIAPSGEVTSATAEPPLKGSPIGSCVAKAFGTQTFPASVEGRSGVEKIATE